MHREKVRSLRSLRTNKADASCQQNGLHRQVRASLQAHLCAGLNGHTGESVQIQKS